MEVGVVIDRSPLSSLVRDVLKLRGVDARHDSPRHFLACKILTSDLDADLISKDASSSSSSELMLVKCQRLVVVRFLFCEILAMVLIRVDRRHLQHFREGGWTRHQLLGRLEGSC